jgi:hypothetical protein
MDHLAVFIKEHRLPQPIQTFDYSVTCGQTSAVATASTMEKAHHIAAYYLLTKLGINRNKRYSKKNMPNYTRYTFTDGSHVEVSSTCHEACSYTVRCSWDDGNLWHTRII